MIAPLLFVVLCVQDTIPLKPQDDFRIVFELSFKKRGDETNVNLVRLNETERERDRRLDHSPLPFLKATLELQKLQPEEVRLRIEQQSGATINKRKIEVGTKQEVFAGFTDDLKADVEQHYYTIYFLTKDGVAVSKIVIEFDEEGFYSVNGQRKGKI
jgi:hypothetical protein